MNPSESLLLKSLNDTPIGETKNFVWFITEIGIAALVKNKKILAEDSDYINEGHELGLDLSKEEIEYFQINQKIVTLFYS